MAQTYPRTVTFTSPSGKVRQAAAARNARFRQHYVHTRYARRISNITFRPR